jgi:hypothetical protein
LKIIDLKADELDPDRLCSRLLLELGKREPGKACSVSIPAAKRW